ncbi:MAG: glycosyltransferase family 39 protein [Bacteroidetes bacterium]|nr:glycosyltransferase family 39 protein [Bacteroidota bacterium]
MFAAIKKNPLRWFFIGWILLNIVQAYTTQLLDDEAYYWVYSRQLDWGYFDHPPMIAFLIKIGYALFPNELGVRLFMVILNGLTLWLMYKMLFVKNERLFMAMAASMAVLQIGGVLAVPDIPLTFFTALFFWQYKQFLEKNSVASALLLGLVMALMLYSKYHGILIIFFTVLSNWRLALQWKAWLAVIAAVLLFTPHVYWQYQHDFPSVWYHLKERNAPTYRLAFTTEYLAGQLAFAGPLIGWLLYYAVIKEKTPDPFGRALKYSSLGIIVFFAISTLKGRVEANWTAPVLVPLVILAHRWLAANDRFAVWVYRLCLPVLALIFILRLYMAVDVPALNERFRDEMHNNIGWAQAIKEKAAGRPVVFTNSYQYPSKYWFYAQDTAFDLNSTSYRRNLYNFSSLEQQFQHRLVYLVETVLREGADSIATPKGVFRGTEVRDFQSWSGIKLQPVSLPLQLVGGQTQDLLFRSSENLAGKQIVLDVYKGDQLHQRILLAPQGLREGVYSAPITLTGEAGMYRAKLGIATNVTGLISQNSPTLALELR